MTLTHCGYAAAVSIPAGRLPASRTARHLSGAGARSRRPVGEVVRNPPDAHAMHHLARYLSRGARRAIRREITQPALDRVQHRTTGAEWMGQASLRTAIILDLNEALDNRSGRAPSRWPDHGADSSASRRDESQPRTCSAAPVKCHRPTPESKRASGAIIDPCRLLRSYRGASCVLGSLRIGFRSAASRRAVPCCSARAPAHEPQSPSPEISEYRLKLL